MAVSGKIRRGKQGFYTMANNICTCKWTISQLSCSFAVPELLKSALVLVLVLLVVVLLLLLLLVVVVVAVGVGVVVVVVAAAHLIFAFLWVLKNVK